MPRERSADLFFRSAVFPNVHGPFPVLKAVADLFFQVRGSSQANPKSL